MPRKDNINSSKEIPEKRPLTQSERVISWRMPLGILIAIGALIGSWRLANRPKSLFNPDEIVLPCGANLEQFVPVESPAYEITKNLILNDCRDTRVPKLFIEANAYAYSTEFCLLKKLPLPTCNTMKGRFKSVKGKQEYLSPTSKINAVVGEGTYQVVKLKDLTLITRLSFCTGLVITSPDSSEALAAHINAENLQAHDEYLKRRFDDPFLGIRDFIARQSLDWEVTLVSGSALHLAHIKTILEHMGLNNISCYFNQNWSRFPDFNQLNQGNIMLHQGRVSFIKNSEDFETLTPLLSQSQKDKPAILRSK